MKSNSLPYQVFSKLFVVALFIIVGFTCLVLFTQGCGGGGESSSNDIVDDEEDTGIPLKMTLQQGDYWEFFWISECVTSAQGSGTTTDINTGRFRVELGAAEEINGNMVFPLIVTGKTSEEGTDFAPAWTHVAVSNDSLLGYLNGELKTIYDGTNTDWSGGGFFVTFDPSDELSASSGSFPSEYNQLSAIVVGHKKSSGGCENILGELICDDTSTTFSEHEYYKAGMGPLGYVLDISFSSCGGGYCTYHQRNKTVELVETSLTATDGETVKPPPWSEVASLNTPRSGHAAVVLNGEIYVLGGYDANGTVLDSMEIYNPGNNTWRFSTSLLPERFADHAAEVIDGKIYVLDLDRVQIYDPQADSWTEGAQIPYDDPSLDSTVWFDNDNNHKFVVIITPDGTDGQLKVYGYEISEDLWYYGTSLSTSDHRWFSIASIGDDIFIVGGYRQFSYNNKITGRTHRYNLRIDEWEENIASLNKSRYATRSVNFGGEIVTLGGEDGIKELRTVEAYNPAAGSWRQLPSMFQPRRGFDAVVLDGSIYVIGGKAGSTTLNSVEVYTPPQEP